MQFVMDLNNIFVIMCRQSTEIIRNFSNMNLIFFLSKYLSLIGVPRIRTSRYIIKKILNADYIAFIGLVSLSEETAHFVL